MMDIETAKEIRSSLHWKAIVEEIDAKVDYEVSKLKTCIPEEVLSIQAKVSALESFTRLPADVIDREE